MRRSIIATYKIDFESDSFEEYVATSGSSVAVQQGDPYERIMQESAMVLVDDAMKLEFISTFSIANLKKCYRAGQTDVTLDYESPQPDGRIVWLRNSLHLFTDIKGRLKGYLYLFDIDAYKRQALRLAHQAEHDSGTGVFNKGTTRQKIEMALNLYAMPKTCAFFMIDLDHFKQINDSYGHAVGDEVSRQTAEILTSSFRAEDVVGRLGGDEFCVFYTGQNDVDTLGCKAAQICEAVRHIHPAQNGGSGTSVSIGIARRRFRQPLPQSRCGALPAQGSARPRWLHDLRRWRRFLNKKQAWNRKGDFCSRPVLFSGSFLSRADHIRA